MDIINAHFKKHANWPRPPIECADGFSISVQAHYGAYCQPRPVSRHHHVDHCEKVECGFPNGPAPELAEWKDGDGKDEECVYGYVPVTTVLALIEKHGGLK
jgi:hypothetical protein